MIKRDDQGKYSWELRSCKYWDDFEQAKIVYTNICKRNEFAWDENSYYANQKVFIIPGASKYLLGILNSSVVMWLFGKLLAKLQNNFYEPSAIFIKDFPIPMASNRNLIGSLVDQILDAKYSDSLVDTSALEIEINRLVYELYGLTKKEISFIEDRTKL